MTRSLHGATAASENESAYIQYVAEEIARLKGISVEEVLTQTEINAKAGISAAGSIIN